MLALAAALILAAPDPVLEDARIHVRFFVGSGGTADAIVAELDAGATASAKKLSTVSPGKREAVRRRLVDNVVANLREKRAAAFPLTADEIRQSVVGYELYKAEAFVSSGVFPKRYSGYVDGKWDTAPYEKRLRELTTKGAAIANAHLAKRGSTLRVTPLEVTATFLSEGGAILLREEQAQLENIHPVFGVGLDDIGSGFEKHAALVKTLDTTFGTGLEAVAKRDGKGEYAGGTTLTRNFTFDEAVLGTLAMWVFEKEIAERKMRDTEKVELSSLPLDEQFVAGSLVYNSGLLFAKDRREWIRDLSTGAYLDGVSKNAKNRPALPVADPAGSLAQLVSTGYPDQPTSWSAVYHVLQRYGAYVGLLRFSGAFTKEGEWRGPASP